MTLFFYACDDEITTLPAATGKSSEVIFVVDDILWESSLRSLVEKTISTDINGLSKKESLFSPFQLNKSEFNSILRTHRNIVIVSKGVKPVITQNKWAYGQLVAQINWNGNEDITTADLSKLKKSLVENELKLLGSKLSKSSQKDIELSVYKNLGRSLIVPEEYSILNNNETFFWASYDPQHSDEIKNIFVYSFNINSNSIQNEVLNRTDSIFAKYLRGDKEGSYATIENRYTPYFSNNVYRGLWRLENGFMGGPFMIKFQVLDTKVIVSVGLVFAPHSSKRRFIKEFEAIL